MSKGAFDRQREKAAAKAIAKTGRLVWIEPNKIDEVSDTGTFDYEDYSICVDLEVKIPKRGSCGNEDELIVFQTNHTTAKDRISFFTGTDGFLTTSFTDITAADPTSNKETLGVSSIDITYNSYFYPQVTIKFVDVRGSSLMYPQEDMFKNGSQGSFFKALFCFPYPQFTLKVKGFYGKQVEYTLAVEDFKTSFNPESGNFECVVKFIGYMYGVYADVPMSYLIVAPYAETDVYNGRTYWEEQKNNGTFVYNNGNPLHTFIELKQKLKDAADEIKKLLQGDANVIAKETLIKEQNSLVNIQSKFQNLIRNLPETCKYNKTGILICNELKFKIKPEALVAWGSLNESIYNHNTNSEFTKIDFINNIQKHQFPQITDDFKNAGFTATNNNEIEPKKIESGNGKSFFEGIKDTSLTESFSFLENKEFYAIFFKDCNIIDVISEREKKIEEELKEIEKTINKISVSAFNTVLGFYPSLNNIFRIIFAHMDTFVHLYYSVLKDIKQVNRNGRNPQDFQLTADNSDLSGIEDFVPPYPLVVKKDNDKGVVMWPGDYTPAKDMVELKFVESLFKAIEAIRFYVTTYGLDNLSVEDEIASLSIPSGEQSYDINNIVFNMYPATITDLYYFKNPYDVFKNRNNLRKDSLYSTLGYRLIDMMRGTGSDPMCPTTKGKIEAYNFKIAVPKLHSEKDAELISLFKGYHGGDESQKDAVKNEFIKFLKGDEVTLVSLNAKPPFHNRLGNVILNGDNYPFGFTDISAVLPHEVTDKGNPKNKVQFKLTPIHPKNVGYFWDIYKKIILTKVNLGESEQYYKGFWQKSFKINDSKYINEYSEDDGVGYFNENIYQNWLGRSYEESYRWKWLAYLNKGLYFNKIDATGYQYKWDVKYLNHPEMTNNGAATPDFWDSNNGGAGASVDCALKYFKDSQNMPCYVLDPSYMFRTSLYCSEIFYLQNEIKDATKRNLAKACLFLEMCGDFNMENDVDPNRIHILPKWHFLTLGSRLYRIRENDHIINVKDNNGKELYKLPKLGKPFVVFEDNFRIPCVLLKGDNKKYQEGHDTFFNSGKGESTDIMGQLNNESKDYLINLFLKWATDEFPKLNDELEWKTKEGGKIKYTYYKFIFNYFNAFITGFGYFGNTNIKTFTDGKGKKFEPYTLNFDPSFCFDKKTLNNYLFKQGCGYPDGLALVDCSAYGFYIPLNPGSVISNLLMKSKFEIMVYSPLYVNKYNNEDGVKKYIDAFLETLYTLYNNDDYITSEETVDETTTITQTLTKNKDLKLSLYLTLKNLYDRWFCGLKRDRWNFNYYINKKSDIDKICEFNKFFFIDSFYNDIGNDMTLNLAQMIELFNSVITNRIGDDTYAPNGAKFQGISMYQFMASILQKNSMNFLAVPCFNTFKSESDIRDLFTPFSWFDRGEPRGTSYVGLYPHQVSAHLNIEDGGEYGYSDDSFEIGNYEDIEIPDLINEEGGYSLPAFGVTYGKQDQSFFKKVTVNMDNPQATEFSIGATLDIANRAGDVQKSQSFVGQDLYKVYSNHSYTCTVEMMGNAMITPLMYFQLNNIPMFKGTYMVIKVEHSIAQGNMTTIITGVRMSKYKIPYVNPIIEGNLGGDSGGNDSEGEGLIGGNYTIIPGTPADANEAINRFIEAARSAVVAKYGEQPADSNRVPNPPELPIQGHDKNYAWCAIFVAWCSEKAGLNNTIIGGTTDYNGKKVWYKGKNWTQPYTTFCQTHYQYYTKLGRFIEKNAGNKVNNPPQMGDLILFLNNEGNYESSGRKYGHIGIVESYNAETGNVTYIHGNNSTNVVARKTEKYETNRIGGFARPPFGSIVTSNGNSNSATNNTTTNQTSTDTDTQNSDTTMLRTVEEKINFIKAVICQESENKHSAVGDKKLIGGNAVGIMQIRPSMYKEINRVRNLYKNSNYILGQPFSGTDGTEEERKALTRDDQVKGFIAVMEHINKIDNSYLSTGQNKTSTAIPWDFRKCCAKWNCGNEKKKCNNYFNRITTWYNKIKSNPSSFLPGDGNGWTPNAAFNSFFS